MWKLFVVAFVCIVLVGCSRNLQTSDLSNSTEFQSLVGQTLLLEDGEKTWALAHNNHGWITNFSEGNSLALYQDLALYQSLLSEQRVVYAEPHAGIPEVRGVMTGGTIVIEHVGHFGMVTPHPVVTGYVTTPDGETLPFEAEWRDGYFTQIRQID